MPLPPGTEAFQFPPTVPSKAQSVTLRIRIQPKGGMVFLYPSMDATQPLQCEAPGRHVTVGYGSGTLYMQKVGKVTELTIEVLGWN